MPGGGVRGNVADALQILLAVSPQHPPNPTPTHVVHPPLPHRLGVKVTCRQPG